MSAVYTIVWSIIFEVLISIILPEGGVKKISLMVSSMYIFYFFIDLFLGLLV